MGNTEVDPENLKTTLSTTETDDDAATSDSSEAPEEDGRDNSGTKKTAKDGSEQVFDPTSLNSLIPLIEGLKECVLENKEYHIDGCLSEHAKEIIATRADQVDYIDITHSSPTEVLAAGTLIQLSSIRVPLFPNLSTLRIMPNAPDLTYLNLLLSPSLRAVGIHDVENSSQRVISSFFKALPRSLTHMGFTDALPRSATFKRISSFHNLTYLLLNHTHDALDPALIPNLGTLPGLLVLEILLGSHKYKPRLEDGPALRPCGHLSILPCPSPCRPAFEPGASTRLAPPPPDSDQSASPSLDSANNPMLFPALQEFTFKGTVSEAITILSSISSRAFFYLQVTLDLVKFKGNDAKASTNKSSKSSMSATHSAKPSPRRQPPNTAKMQIDAWAHSIERFLLLKKKLSYLKATLIGSTVLHSFPMPVFSTAINNPILKELHIGSGWALQHDDPMFDAIFNSASPLQTPLTNLSLPYARPTPFALTFLSTLTKRFPKLQELQCLIGGLDEIAPFNFTGPPVVPSQPPNASPALTKLTVLNSVQTIIEKEEAFAIAVYLHSHFPDITVTSLPQSEVVIKDDEVDPQEFWTEINHLLQLCRAGAKNWEARHGVSLPAEVEPSGSNEAEAVQDDDVVMRADEDGPEGAN